MTTKLTLTDEMRANIKRIEAEYKTTVVAVVLNDDDSIYDHTFNWESGQNYALSQGYRVVAIADDGHMTKDNAQALYDAERDRYRDCYGIDTNNQEDTMDTNYFLVAVDDNGDVMAAPAKLVSREGLTITLSTEGNKTTDFAFENQGNDGESKWESARDALAAVMPNDDDN